MAINVTIKKEQEISPLVRYQVQAIPGCTRLLVEFTKSQDALLRQLLKLLLQPSDYPDKENIENVSDTEIEAGKIIMTIRKDI